MFFSKIRTKLESARVQDLECLSQAHVVASDGAAHASKRLPVKRVDDDDPVSHQAQLRGDTERTWQELGGLANGFPLKRWIGDAERVRCADLVVSGHTQSPNGELRIARCVASYCQCR
jgi:hypothetical protein